jgi:hypothetical protein
MLTRLPDWQTRLQRFFVDHHSEGFEYGHLDCCLFACDAILAMTGTDIAEWFRGRYSTRKEAMVLVREFAGKATTLAVAERVTEANGMSKVEVLRLQRGDVALIKRGERDHSLGIVALNGTEIVTVSKDGLVRVPLNLALAGWRV